MVERRRPKSEAKAGQSWTPKEVEQLRQLAAGNTPTRVIGVKLQRPAGGVQQKAYKQGISLRPNNQSPYNRRKG